MSTISMGMEKFKAKSRDFAFEELRFGGKAAEMIGCSSNKGNICLKKQIMGLALVYKRVVGCTMEMSNIPRAKEAPVNRS